MPCHFPLFQKISFQILRNDGPSPSDVNHWSKKDIAVVEDGIFLSPYIF